jgi:hypothetical protein
VGPKKDVQKSLALAQLTLFVLVQRQGKCSAADEGNGAGYQVEPSAMPLVLQTMVFNEFLLYIKN